METPAAIGVDNGGTWIRLKALDARGRTLWSVKKQSPSVQELPAFLKRELKRFHGAVPALAVGSRGVWKKAKRRKLTKGLQGLAKRIVVMSDVEAAWLAAFKDKGIIVISGTGSIAYGRSSDGKSARAGGLGPDKGDEGSGFWIGKMWLNANRTKKKRMYTVRQAAQLAPAVIRKAAARNPVAQRIVSEAQSHLAQITLQVIKKLHLKRPVPVGVSGSVLSNTSFQKGFYGMLVSQAIRRKAARTDAATALARSIMSHARS